jgi:hypothetical protein
MRFKDFIAKVDPQPRPKPKLKPKEWVPGALYRCSGESRTFTIRNILPYYQFVGGTRVSSDSDRPVIVSTEGHANFQDTCELV